MSRQTRSLLILLFLIIGSSVVAVFAQSSPVEWGRVGPGIVGATTGDSVTTTWNGTSYTGRADSARQTGASTTWSGQVRLSFHDSKMDVLADEVTSDPKTNELVLRGDVRIRMDIRDR